MTRGEAKDYLKTRGNEIRNLEKAVERKRERYARMRARLTGGTTVLTGMPSAHGGGNGTLDSMTALADLAKEINADVDGLTAAQTALAEQIKRYCDLPEMREVLERRYVDGWEWPRIARTMYYTIDGIFGLHGRAVKTFAREGKGKQ